MSKEDHVMLKRNQFNARFGVFVTLLACSIFLVPVQKAAAETFLRVGCTNPAGSVLTEPIDRFIEIVKKNSSGEIAAKNFYQALGIEQQLTQAVMSGTVDIGGMTTASATTFSDAFFPYELPFLFRSYEDMLGSLKGPVFKKQLAKFEEKTGLKVLAIFSVGSGRDIQTREKQLRVPADIKGLKIRTTASPIEVETYRAWGANPTPVNFSQTLTALQQGTVDGLDLDTPAVLSTKMYEAVKFNTRLSYQMNMYLFFMNGAKYKSLGQQQQKVIWDAAKEVETWNHQDAATRVAADEAKLTALGVATYHPSEEEWKQWAAVRDQVWAKVAIDQKGKLDMDLVKQLSGQKK